MVIWSQPARADLKHIHDFIAKDSGHYARKVVQEIKNKADTLNEPPNIGKKVPETDNPRIQELSIYSYRIMYELKTSGAIFWPWFISAGILVQRICHKEATKKKLCVTT